MSIHPEQSLVAGDVVMIRAVVEVASPKDSEYLYLRVGDALGARCSVTRPDADLISTVIAIGDEVVGPVRGVTGTGIVAAIVSDKAWVEWLHEYGASIVPLDDLRRIRTADQVRDDERERAKTIVLPQAAE